ncbi:hypothetical protein ANCCEY_04630 [Ancylostoma ceylanicum]|nr:hypothetical protein ANCCEY_04630 [Ancylostoma ceylanicum]
MESKTQEVVPEDEKPPDRPSKAGKSLKAGTPSGKDQKHSQKASKVPGARAKHSSKKPVYKAKKPSEYVSVFAGSMAPKAAGSAAPTKPTKEPAANLPATGGPVQASAAAKEPSKPGQVSATKPSVAVPATSTKPVTVAKETPKLTPAPTAVPTKQPGTTPAGTTSKPAAGPAQQQPSLPGGPVPAPAPGPPSKIPSDCVRV